MMRSRLANEPISDAAGWQQHPELMLALCIRAAFERARYGASAAPPDCTVQDRPFMSFDLLAGTSVAHAVLVGLLAVLAKPAGDHNGRYSTVTLLARLRGWSTSVPLATAT